MRHLSQIKATDGPELEEIFLLAVPLVMIGIVLLQAQEPFTTRDYKSWLWVKNFVFMNVLHVGFTAALLFIHPKVRALVGHQFISRPRSFPLELFLVCGLSAAGFFLIGDKRFRPEVNSSLGPLYYQLSLFLLFYIVPIHHGHSQIFGISSSYTATSIAAITGLSAEEKKRKMNAYIREEKLCFRILTSSFLLAIFSQFPLARVFLGHSQAFFFWALWATCALAAAAIIARSFQLSLSFKNRKAWFSLRVLLFPLSFFSQIATLGIGMMHGSEALVVFLKLIRSESPEKKYPLRRYAQLLLPAMAAIFLLSLYEHIPIYTWDDDHGRYLVAAYFTIVSFHYYFERLFFRARHPDFGSLSRFLSFR